MIYSVKGHQLAKKRESLFKILSEMDENKRIRVTKSKKIVEHVLEL